MTFIIMYVHIWIVYFIYTHAGSTDVSQYNNKIPPLIKYNIHIGTYKSECAKG